MSQVVIIRLLRLAQGTNEIEPWISIVRATRSSPSWCASWSHWMSRWIVVHWPSKRWTMERWTWVIQAWVVFLWQFILAEFFNEFLIDTSSPRHMTLKKLVLRYKKAITWIINKIFYNIIFIYITISVQVHLYFLITTIFKDISVC